MGNLSLGKTMNKRGTLIGVLLLLLFAVFINSLAYIITRKEEPQEPESEVNYISHMKASDAESVLAIINAEGFDSAFNHYSSYRDINDRKFHDLRRAYIAASKELKEYLEECACKTPNVPYYLSYESSN